MKKYFMFATLATAALFASCSSSDDLAQGVEPVEEGSGVPIEVNVGNSTTVTRGTGTVGGVVDGTGAAVGGSVNQWTNQTFNLLMLEKGTMNYAGIYDNTVMTTPKGTDVVRAMELVGTIGDGTNDASINKYKETLRYYPQTGKFDFWAYRLDDATGVKVNKTDANINVDFTIDGSQDIMAGKAPQTDAEIPAGDEYFTDARKTVITDGDAYSAAAARKDVQPNIRFEHMLTRLSFEVKAGNADAAGVTGSTRPGVNADNKTIDTQESYTGVKITGVHVQRVTNPAKTGNLVVATIGDDHKTLTWTALEDDAVAPAQYAQSPAEGGYTEVDEEPTEVAVAQSPADLGLSEGEEGYDDASAAYTAYTTYLTAKANYEQTQNWKKYTAYREYVDAHYFTLQQRPAGEEDNQGTKLIPLTEAIPGAFTDADNADANTIGEALLVPTANEDKNAYELIIDMEQRVPIKQETTVNENKKPWEEGYDTPGTKDYGDGTKTTYAQYAVKLDADKNRLAFEAGKSYKVTIVVYGLEQIKVYATLAPWIDGGEAEVIDSLE